MAQATVQSGGLTAVVTGARTATLSDPTNPLSLRTLTDTVTVNGRATTTVYTAATRTATTTAPTGRVRTAIRDDQAGSFKPKSPAWDRSTSPATDAVARPA